jgi:hypothetical protein
MWRAKSAIRGQNPVGFAGLTRSEYPSRGRASRSHDPCTASAGLSIAQLLQRPDESSCADFVCRASHVAALRCVRVWGDASFGCGILRLC